MKKSTMVIMMVLVAGLTVTAWSDVVVGYDFNNLSDAATATNANVTASIFDWNALNVDGETKSDGEVYTAGYVQVSSGNVSNEFGVANASTEANCMTAESYFSFTVSPNAGAEMDLTSLTFRVDYYGANNSGQTTTFFVRSSVDGFTTTLGTPVDELTGVDEVWTPVTIDLSGASFQNLTEDVTFIIGAYDYGVTGISRYARVDDVVLNGSVVPEPATIGLFGVSLVGLLTLRRLQCS